MILGSILALISSLSWGTGDFFGGLSTRRFPRYSVMAWMSFVGILTLIVCLLIWPENGLTPGEIAWSCAAGVCGLLGLGLLYAGLAGGHAATVAPTAAVIGAALPVAFGYLQGSRPGVFVQIGFGLALAGIALVSAADGPSQKVRLSNLLLAICAGINFGCFYLFLSFIEGGHTYLPLVFSRGTVILITLLLIWRTRSSLKSVMVSPLVWMNGLFDAGGNIFYMLARQYTDLSIAVVLSSLYPAVTVLLSWRFLREHINRRQWMGVVCCLGAVALISVG
jgi:drug/metabolite transporter (DMT)-like permease